MGRIPCVATGTVPSAVTFGLWRMGAVPLNCRINKRRLPLGLVQHLLFFYVRMHRTVCVCALPCIVLFVFVPCRAL